MKQTLERQMAEQYAYGQMLTHWPEMNETFKDVCANLLNDESEVEYSFTEDICQLHVATINMVNALKELVDSIEDLLLDHCDKITLRAIACTQKF